MGSHSPALGTEGVGVWITNLGLPAISLCLFFPCPGAVASPPASACPQPSETLPRSAQRDPFTPGRGHGYSSSSPCPARGSQHLSAPQIGICQTSPLPGREGSRSRVGAAAQMIHPHSSVWRALQPRSSSQPSPASSGAPGERRVFQNPDGGWGHEKGFVQPASGSGAAGKHRELGGTGRGVDLGWWVQPLVFLGAKKHHAKILGFSSCSLLLTTAIPSKSKSKGELWLHPYLWQSRVLSPTPPREAWHHCLPVQLEGLSLTGCAPRGCYVGASPMPE